MEKPKSYYPLILVFLYLVGATALFGWAQRCEWMALGHCERSEAISPMAFFMGAFFVVFSFFKLLNLKGFAKAYASYDIVAKRWEGYGYVYPFIELTLGVLYLTGLYPFETNLATLVVMSVSSIGVIESLIHQREIQCACLGTFFDLPMSKVTLFEDALMVVMAAVMLFA